MIHVKALKDDTAADVRSDIAIQVGALFFVALILLAFTTDPVATGTREGDRAPPLEGKAYNGSGWTDFDLNDYLTPDWVSNDSSAAWVVVDFMDTDCPYCVRASGDVYQYSNYFMKYAREDNGEPSWRGPLVHFIGSATELDIAGHESSQQEIEDFRDRSGDSECAGSPCSGRDGAVHQFTYIDDLDQDNMKSWKIGGTPTYFLLQPDGIVAWASSENPGETVSDAIFRLTEGLIE